MNPRRYAPLAVFLVLLAAGCQKKQEATLPPAEGGPGVAAEAPAPAPLPTSEPLIAPTMVPAAAPGVAPAMAPPPVAAPAGTVIASQETNWSGIVAEVTEFRRKGNTLTAKVRFRNQGTETSEPDIQYKEVYVMDAAAGKKYEVLKDEKGAYIAALNPGWPERWYKKIPPGESQMIWMKFPAPPLEVKAITLQLPGMPPFEDMPIQD